MQDFALGLSTLAIGLTSLNLLLSPDCLLLFPVLLNIEFNLGAFELGGVDLLKPLSAPVVAEELEEDSLDLLEVPTLEMLNRPPDDVFLLLLEQDLLLPNVEFL